MSRDTLEPAPPASSAQPSPTRASRVRSVLPLAEIAAAAGVPLSETIFDAIPWLREDLPIPFTARVGLGVKTGRYRLVTRFVQGELKTWGRRLKWGPYGMMCDLMMEWTDEQAFADWMDECSMMPVQVLLGSVTVKGEWTTALLVGELLKSAQAFVRNKLTPNKSQLLVAHNQLKVSTVARVSTVEHLGFCILSLGSLLYCCSCWSTIAAKWPVRLQEVQPSASGSHISQS
ncbi:MAG: hypothetical protein SGPRY_005800 [Prymnesium sp.]